MKGLSRFILWANIALVIATALSYIAPKIDPEVISIFSFFGLSFPVLLVLNLFFVFIWCFVNIRNVFIPLITLAIGWVFIKGFVAINTEKPSVTNHDFSVISFNISNGLYAYDGNSEVKKEKMVLMNTFLQRFADEDIICLQEVGLFAQDLLNKNYPNYQMHNINKGAIILSKHPIINKGEIPFGTITNSCLWADIVINLDTFRVYSLHLQSNKISKDADDMVQSGTLNDKKTWLGIKSILKKYRFHHIKRAQQAKMVKTHIQKSKYPVIVCGDFNDTPLSFTYSHISKGLIDAFNERGTGIGTTYSGTIPFLRIDYILTSPFLRPLRFQVIKEKHSDHYPIAAVYTYNRVKE